MRNYLAPFDSGAQLAQAAFGAFGTSDASGCQVCARVASLLRWPPVCWAAVEVLLRRRLPGNVQVRAPSSNALKARVRAASLRS